MALLWIGVILNFLEFGIALFGGAHAKFYHQIPPGYVEIHIAARGSAGRNGFYVKPWVATLHTGVLGLMFACFIAAFCLFILIRMVKRAEQQP